MPAAPAVTAAILIIGDEILSGRTQDANLAYMAQWLGELGIEVAEARVVPDDERRIADAVNQLRAAYDYVLTTGGIGPTHDDITAESVAAAFGVPIEENAEALARLNTHYVKGEVNESRRRMARIPRGATLIDNPISAAPGFLIGNVFVLAGIPAINRAMLESLRHHLKGGVPILSRVVGVSLPEGRLANPLRAIQARYPDVAIGSYPYYRGKTFGASLVLRSKSERDLQAALDDVIAMIKDLGAEPLLETPSA